MNSQAKQLMRKLGQLSQEIEEKPLPKNKEQENKKKKVKKQLDKIKKIGPKNKNIKKEIEKLERYILDALFLEEQILNKENQDFSKIQNQINELKSTEQPSQLKLRIEKLENLIGELASRVESYMDVETQRDQRVEEVQKKIQKNLNTNFKELMELSKKIINMEDKLEKLRESEKLDEKHLSSIEQKIESLREKLRQKQIEIINRKREQLPKKKKEKLPELPKREESQGLPAPGKKEEIESPQKKKETPAPKKPSEGKKVRHRMLFEPKEDLEKEFKKEYEKVKEEAKKETPPKMPKMPEPPKPKKSFFASLIDKIKGIFKKKE